MISMFEVPPSGSQQVLAISDEPCKYSEDDEEPFKPEKMSRAEFLMAQVDLDVIESRGSQELSTVHHKNKEKQNR